MVPHLLNYRRYLSEQYCPLTPNAIPFGLPEDLLQSRLDIVEIEENLKAANARIGEARAYFSPTVAFIGTGGFQSSEFDQWFNWASRNLSVGPSVSLPIFEGYTNMPRLEVPESRYQQMLEQYQHTILNAFREVADVLTALQTRQEQLVHQQQRVDSSQDARELVEIRYRQGLVTYLDVLEAERTVLPAELELVQTQRARLTDMVIPSSKPSVVAMNKNTWPKLSPSSCQCSGRHSWLNILNFIDVIPASS